MFKYICFNNNLSQIIPYVIQYIEVCVYYITLKAPLCYLQIQEHLTKQLLISETTSKELNKTEAVNIDLKKELEFLTKRVETFNQMSKLLCGTTDDVSTCKIEAVTVS